MLGIIAVADVVKPDSPGAVSELKKMGLRVVMLTGDNQKTAAAIGKQAGVDEVIAGVLPDGKAAVVERLCREGKTAMVGDGINDAPALTTADVGIAIGAGADVAIEAADVVLMKSRLRDVPAAIKLGRATLRNIHQNLFWAFIYNVIGIPLAAGVFIFLGWRLNPMFGAAAMSLSSFCVVTNALRLNFARIYPKTVNASAPSEVTTNILPTKEQTNMTITMNINGMMCEHCEARVKKTLEAIPQVEKAEVSHTENRAVVTLKEEVPFSVLKEAVEAQDYEVVPFLTPSTVPTETMSRKPPLQRNPQQLQKAETTLLQTMLAAEIGLDMPTRSGHVLRPTARTAFILERSARGSRTPALTLTAISATR